MLEQMKSWVEVGLFIAILVMFFGLIARSNVRAADGVMVNSATGGHGIDGIFGRQTLLN